MKESERFLRIEDVIKKTGLKRSTIYDKMKKNEFPKSVTISVNNVAWLESEIHQWMQNKIAERDNQTGE